MSEESHPAPAGLEPVQTFINSVNLERHLDPLVGPDRLEEWCRTSGLCSGASPEELGRLRAFREALRTLIEANAGTGEASSAWAALEPFAREAGYGMRIEAGLPVLEPTGSGAARAIAALLGSVYDAIRRGQWSRLKACRKESCRWAYYDRSKNGSGAWCSMAVCGNRMKAKRRRNRAKKPA